MNVMSTPALGAPNASPLQRDLQRQMHLAIAPGLAQFVRRHRHGRKGAGGLGLEEAEVLGQFRRDQIAQADSR